MTYARHPISTKIIPNQITGLYMGLIDIKTGKWFPWQKMTWAKQKGTEYLDCTLAFLEGAKDYEKVYPLSVKVCDYGEIRHYPQLSYSPWRNRLPVVRPLENRYRKIFGFKPDEKIDPVEYASVSGGYRHGDKNYLFPELAPDKSGNYNYIFRGMDSWYMPSSNRPEIETIPIGARVTLQLPQQWLIDPGEWSEHTPAPEVIRMPMLVEGKLVGYAPPYIKDLYLRFGDSLHVTTYRKNKGLQFDSQFLFQATISQTVGIPFSEARYQTYTAN